MATENQLAASNLHRAASRIVMSTLARLGVPSSDREDIAQEVVMTALQRWPTYRWDKGSPAQWLRGIAAKHGLKHRRKKARQAARVERLAREPRPGLPAVEEEVLVMELEDFIARLPALLGRAVWLREVADFSFDQIADSEHVAKVTAHRRYERGMQMLREMLEEQQGAAVVPVTLAEVFAAERGPELPEEVVERLRRRVGLQAAPPATPRGRKLSLVRWAGLAGVVLALSPSSDGSAHADAAVIVAEAAPTPAAPYVAEEDASNPERQRRDAANAPPPCAAMASPAATTAHAAGSPKREDSAWDPEESLIRRARSALQRKQLPQALAALAEHAERFPAGRHAGEREHLRAITAEQRAASLTAGGSVPNGSDSNETPGSVP